MSTEDKLQAIRDRNYPDAFSFTGISVPDMNQCTRAVDRGWERAIREYFENEDKNEPS